MKQMQTHSGGTLTHGGGSPASQSPAQVRRAVLKARNALDKLPTGQSMVASLIDESLAQSSPRGSPRAKQSSPRGSPRAKQSSPSNKSKREADAAALRSKMDELQLRRGVLMGTITDVERSLGNKKKDITTLNMLAELTVQLGEIDDRTVAIGNEIAELLQDPEEELRELLHRVRDDKKMLRALARIMVEALPTSFQQSLKEPASEATASTATATTIDDDDGGDELTIVAAGSAAAAAASDDEASADSVVSLPEDMPVPPIPGDADADEKEGARSSPLAQETKEKEEDEN